MGCVVWTYTTGQGPSLQSHNAVGRCGGWTCQKRKLLCWDDSSGWHVEQTWFTCYIHGVLQFHNKSTRWVPKEVVPVLEKRCVGTFQKLLWLYRTEGDALLQGVRAVRKHGRLTRSMMKDFQFSFLYFGDVLQQSMRCWHKQHLTSTEIVHTIHLTHSTNIPPIWVDDEGAFCKICETLSSRC